MREGKGQKCKGLSFDSKVHADPEAGVHKRDRFDRVDVATSDGGGRLSK